MSAFFTANDKESLDVNTLKHSDLCHIKLCRNPNNPGPTSVARAVAKAMSDQGPPEETILQRSALLQVKKQKTYGLTTEHITLILSSEGTELINLAHLFNRRN